MLGRVYRKNLPASARITYAGVSVCKEWLNLEIFAEWFNSFNYQAGWELDKDLLCKGNKEYSPHTCTIVPAEINTFLCNRKNHRGKQPVGVYFREKTGRYLSNCSTGGGKPSEFLGSYSTAELAFGAYKLRKEGYAKELAEKYKDQIEPRAYQALLNYKVEIDD